MKKLIAVLVVAMLAVACIPSLPDYLPDIVTLQQVELPVAEKTDELWRSDDYAGKPVFIVFMGSWCPWCKKTMPAVVALKEKYGDQVEIVGAFVDGAPGPVRDVVKEHGFTVKALYGAGEVSEGLGVSGFPHAMLFNKNHQLVETWEGYDPNMEKLVSVSIEKLIK